MLDRHGLHSKPHNLKERKGGEEGWGGRERERGKNERGRKRREVRIREGGRYYKRKRRNWHRQCGI